MDRSAQVVVISGSLRKQSRNTALARAFVTLASGLGKTAVLADISGLPLHNEDLEDLTDRLPKEVYELRREVLDAKALVFITPENNMMPSAALKNSLDWISRFGPDAATISASSPGAISPLSNKHIWILSAAGPSKGLNAQEVLRGALTKMSQRYQLVVRPETLAINLFDGVDRFDTTADLPRLKDLDTLEQLEELVKMI
jgi:NAD(P)H-dependent FMN reductase